MALGGPRGLSMQDMPFDFDSVRGTSRGGAHWSFALLLQLLLTTCAPLRDDAPGGNTAGGTGGAGGVGGSGGSGGSGGGSPDAALVAPDTAAGGNPPKLDKGMPCSRADA